MRGVYSCAVRSGSPHQQPMPCSSISSPLFNTVQVGSASLTNSAYEENDKPNTEFPLVETYQALPHRYLPYFADT